MCYSPRHRAAARPRPEPQGCCASLGGRWRRWSPKEQGGAHARGAFSVWDPLRSNLNGEVYEDLHERLYNKVLSSGAHARVARGGQPIAAPRLLDGRVLALRSEVEDEEPDAADLPTDG